MVRRRVGLRWRQAGNDALAWLRRAAAARAVQMVALRAVAGALWTSYDASFPAIWVEGDEKALQSRRQAS
jgi:hypothetical protein